MAKQKQCANSTRTNLPSLRRTHRCLNLSQNRVYTDLLLKSRHWVTISGMTGARHCTAHFIDIMILNPHKNTKKNYYHHHVT